ncbi:unnamed protein product [Rotaria sp. Silwood1]|nr:unnamed protein product [Rotaria sp. Silwood1]
MFRRSCHRCWYSNSISEDDQNRISHLTKFQLIKLITSCALPLAVAIFTLVTTLQNRQIALQNRQQDLLESEDDQRQSFFVNYINDISRFRDQNIENLTNNYNKLLYIRTKTLTTLRKLDNERKKYILLFLKESSLLSEDEQSLLSGADFNGIKIDHNDCVFRNVIFSGVYFQQVSFMNCLFENVTFRYVDFHEAVLSHSIFYLTYFISCRMDYVNFQESVISESYFNSSSLSYTDFRQVKIDFVKFYNVNLTKASFSDNPIQTQYSLIRNSLLPNGTFSTIDDINIISNLCTSFEKWSPIPIDGIKVDNCTFVIKISNTTIARYIRRPFIDRSVLIGAEQADFLLELKQKYTMMYISIIIYFVGVEHGVFETQQFAFEAEQDPMNFDQEQIWPSRQDIQQSEHQFKKRDFNEDHQGIMADYANDLQSINLDQHEHEEDEDEEEMDELFMNRNNYDEKTDLEEDKQPLKKLKEAKLDEQFPGEVDTPMDVSARVRFQKYQGLKSFRKTKWNPKENLSYDYGRIY